VGAAGDRSEIVEARSVGRSLEPSVTDSPVLLLKKHYKYA
jgi:hypothetical protein